ncbi:MAG: RNA 3'-terminal phosphate cyclase [Planctomycetes bacterium]|nr:RNA 3'-terminal phosphate cyclase [Planctomycetota bacterium]
MLTINGSAGEGGGQILRTSLALALVTGTPFCIERIRAARPRPGLRPQHLTAVEAARAVSEAHVAGAVLGSCKLLFVPGAVRPGSYRFDVGTAGSTSLVLQTVLPALLMAGAPSSLVLEGGTHNPFAPPFPFLERTFLPLLGRMGMHVETRLDRAGFYPAGGGRLGVSIRPAAPLEPLELLERGPIRRRRAVALVSRLPRSIARRELDRVRKTPGWNESALEIVEVADSAGPGNVLLLEVESAALTEVFSGFGQRGIPAEKVADGVIREAAEYLDAGVPVGRHLADQLLIPLALAGGGAFRTLPLSDHATTNIGVVKRFLAVNIAVGGALGASRIDVRLGTPNAGDPTREPPSRGAT